MARTRKAKTRAERQPGPRWQAGLEAVLTHPASLCLVLAALTLAVYGRTAGFAFLDLDDPFYVTSNPYVLGGLSWENVRWAFFGASEGGYWHPLTWLSLMLDRTLFLDWAGGFHLVNVALHVFNVWLLLWLLLRLFDDVFIACAVAAVFALHPMHQESVAWITERKDVLFMFWGLLTLHGYLSWARQGGWRLWLGFHATFVLSLMSKPALVVLPGILVLLDAWPLGRCDMGLLNPLHGDRQESARARACFWRLVLEKFPLLGLAALSAAVTLLSHPAYRDQFEPGLGLRLGNAAVSYAIYAWKFLAPTGLGIFYPFPQSLPAWQVLCAVLLLLAALGAALWNQRQRPWLLLGLAWFFLGFLTVSVPPRGGLHVAHADRWAYFPFIGAALMLAFGLREAAERIFLGERVRGLALWGALGVLVCWYGGLALLAIPHWRDSVSVYERALAVTEGNQVIEGNYGSLLLRRGDLAGAERHLLRALEIAPHNSGTLTNLAGVYLNTARYGLAIEMYDRAIAADPTFSGRLGDYYYGYGFSLAQLGRYDEAEAQYQRAIEVNPADAEAHNDLGNIAMLRGQTQKAAGLYARAVELKPDYQMARQNLERARRALAAKKP